MICTICQVSDSEKITHCNMNFDFDDLELREIPGGSGNVMICIGTLKAPVSNHSKLQSIVVYTEEIINLQNCFFDSSGLIQ